MFTLTSEILKQDHWEVKKKCVLPFSTENGGIHVLPFLVVTFVSPPLPLYHVALCCVQMLPLLSDYNLSQGAAFRNWPGRVLIEPWNNSTAESQTRCTLSGNSARSMNKCIVESKQRLKTVKQKTSCLVQSAWINQTLRNTTDVEGIYSHKNCTGQSELNGPYADLQLLN